MMFLGVVAIIESLPMLGLIDVALRGSPAAFFKDGEVIETIGNTLKWSASASAIAVGLAIASAGSRWSRSVEKWPLTVPTVGVALGLAIAPALLAGLAEKGASGTFSKNMNRAALLLDPVAPWVLIAALSAPCSARGDYRDRAWGSSSARSPARRGDDLGSKSLSGLAIVEGAFLSLGFGSGLGGLLHLGGDRRDGGLIPRADFADSSFGSDGRAVRV